MSIDTTTPYRHQAGTATTSLASTRHAIPPTDEPKVARVASATDSDQPAFANPTTPGIDDIQAARHTALRAIDAGHLQIPSERISGMQKWEGRINLIEDDIFTAELSPITEEGPSVVADFDLDLLAPETDIAPGDVVYVTARTLIDVRGYRYTTASVRLSRRGKWTEQEISEIFRRARERRDALEDYID